MESTKYGTSSFNLGRIWGRNRPLVSGSGQYRAVPANFRRIRPTLCDVHRCSSIWANFGHPSSSTQTQRPSPVSKAEVDDFENALKECQAAFKEADELLRLQAAAAAEDAG